MGEEALPDKNNIYVNVFKGFPIVCLLFKWDNTWSFPFKRTSFFSNFGYLYSLNTRLLLFFQFLSADESHQPPSLASTLPFPGEDLGEGRGDTKRLGWEDRAWMG